MQPQGFLYLQLGRCVSPGKAQSPSLTTCGIYQCPQGAWARYRRGGLSSLLCQKNWPKFVAESMEKWTPGQIFTPHLLAQGADMLESEGMLGLLVGMAAILSAPTGTPIANWIAGVVHDISFSGEYLLPVLYIVSCVALQSQWRNCQPSSWWTQRNQSRPGGIIWHLCALMQRRLQITPIAVVTWTCWSGAASVYVRLYVDGSGTRG